MSTPTPPPDLTRLLLASLLALAWAFAAPSCSCDDPAGGLAGAPQPADAGGDAQGGGEDDADPSVDAQADTERDAENNAASDTDSDDAPDADTASDTGHDTDLDTGDDTGHDTHGDAGDDVGAGADTGLDTDINPDLDADIPPEHDTDLDTDHDTNTDTGLDVDLDTDLDASADTSPDADLGGDTDLGDAGDDASAAACPNDPYEPTDAPEQAWTPTLNRAYDDPTICPGDVDWLLVPGLRPGQRVYLTLAQRSGQGNLLVRAYDDPAAPPLLQRNLTSAGDTLELEAPAGGDLRFAVLGATADAERGYSLQIEVEDTCQPDAREPNDTLAEAASRLLTPGIYADLALCPDDLDLHCVTVPGNGLLTATISFDHDRGDLELQLVDSAGLPLATSASAMDQEQAAYLNTRAQPEQVCAFVLATGFDPFVENDYTLELALGDTTTCADDALERNDDPEAATLLRDRRDAPAAPIPSGWIFSNPDDSDAIAPLQGLKLCGGAPDVFRFFALAGDQLEVELSFLHARGDLALAAHRLTGITPLAHSDSSDDGELLRFTAPADDAYLITVSGPPGVNQTYNLRVALQGACLDDPREPNDTRPQASPLPLGLTRDIAACAGDEDWYRADLQAGDTLDVAITYNALRANLNVELLAPSGTVVARANTRGDRDALTFTAAQPGAYAVHVYGEDDQANTRYTLEASQRQAGPGCPDDRLERADGAPSPLPFRPEGARTEGLTLCNGDTDRYTFSLLQPAALEVLVDVPFTTPNSAVTLTAPGGATYQPIATPTGRRFALADAPAGRWTLLLTRGPGGPPHVRYGITLAAAPDRCLDDLYAPNETPANAADAGLGALRGLVLCGQTQDCFALPALSGQTLAAQARYDSLQGDVQLRLYTPGGQLAAASNNATQAETLRITADTSGTWTACVSALRALHPPLRYDLDLAVDAPCDASAANDTPERATALPLSTTLPLRTCGGDRWFALPIAPTTPTALTLGAPGGAPALLRVFNASLDLLGEAAVTDGRAELGAATDDGLLLLHVATPEGTPADLTLYAAPAPEAPTCDGPEGGANTAADAPTLTLPALRSATLCDGADLYRVNAPQGAPLEIEVAWEPARGDLALDILDADGREVIAWGQPLRNQLTARLRAPAGGVLLRLRPDPRYIGPYALHVAAAPRVPCADDADEPDDTPAQATRLGAPQGQRRGALCDADADMYAIHLQAGERLEVDLDATDAADLTLLDPAGDPAADASATDAPTRRAASLLAAATGLHFILLDSSDDLGYDLHWRITADATPCAPDPHEPDDTPAQAPSASREDTLHRTACPQDSDLIALHLQPGDRLHLLLDHDGDGSDLDLELIHANGDLLASSAHLRAREALSFTADAELTLYARVLQRGYRATPYTLGVLTIAP